MTFERDSLVDYVVGALTPEQELEVAQYLNDHPKEAAWVRDMFETFANIALAQEPEALAQGAEEALLARIYVPPKEPVESNATAPEDQAEMKATRPQEGKEIPQSAGNVVTLPARSRTPLWIGLLLVLLLAGLSWVFLPPAFQRYASGRQLEQVCNEASITCQDIVGVNATSGTLALRPNNELVLMLNNDPPEGQVYQAWEIVGDAPKSLGVWEGRVLEVSQPLGESSIFGVSIEPPGGSLLPTTAPILVVPLGR